MSKALAANTNMSPIMVSQFINGSFIECRFPSCSENKKKTIVRKRYIAYVNVFVLMFLEAQSRSGKEYYNHLEVKRKKIDEGHNFHKVLCN